MLLFHIKPEIMPMLEMVPDTNKDASTSNGALTPIVAIMLAMTPCHQQQLW